MQTVSLSFYRFTPGLRRVRAFAMMGLARPALRRTPGLQFWKLCGSGTGEGFTPLPNTGVYAILAVWPDGAAARRETQSARAFRRFADSAEESWTVFLEPQSVRGAWGGVRPFKPCAPSGQGPAAALTRARIRPAALFRFWRRVPGISAAIGTDNSVLFKIGIGEVPWLNQITFSIWPDAASMARFARKDGLHAQAIRAVREGGWFREELYARFRVTGEAGSWQGRRPLEEWRRAS